MIQELRHKAGTLRLLLEEYVDRHAAAPTYRYTQFCNLYHGNEASLKRSMRLTHRAGEKLFIDYVGQNVSVIDRINGEIRTAHIFIAVLGASSYTFTCATPPKTRATGCPG